MRLPGDTHRLSIYGQTGSGKTVAGLWHLEQRSWRRRPWVIFDFKRDPVFAQLPRVEEIDLATRPPKAAGLYIVRPLPHEVTEDFLWRVWDRGGTGLFVDEAYMLGRFNKAWNAILTQGRAKRIPVIAGSQRPSWLSPFQMSESNFHQVFHLQRPDDVKNLAAWVPGLSNPPFDHSSVYYDVSANVLHELEPVPAEEVILERFDRRIPKRVRTFGGAFFRNAVRPERRMG